MADEILKHKEGVAELSVLTDGRRKVVVRMNDPSVFSPRLECTTRYPKDLIQLILDVKEPAWLCDEIARDEDPDYVQKHLEIEMRAYFRFEDFDRKRILDFGCGSGASTALLARMFPRSEVVGVELDKNLLRVARSRADYYNFNNVSFLQSPSGENLPDNLGRFDLVVLSAVYEHLLPQERRLLLPTLWGLINDDGILFIDQTPQRYFPLELHTTSLALINYLPDRLTLKASRKFSRRVNENDSWEFLLRAGIRGATVREIRKLLRDESTEARMLKPTLSGLRDRVDLWFATTNPENLRLIKQSARVVLKVVNALTGIAIVPELTLAFRKIRKGS